MRIYRSKNYRRVPLVLKILLSILLLAGISLGIALVWQNKQDTQPPSTSQASSLPPDSNSEPEPTTESSASESESEIPTVSSSAMETSESDESLPEESLPLREKFSQAVPPSKAVSNRYFDDAIFFGDSISTGIPLYQVMKNAAVVAYTGINTQSINTKPVIETPNGLVTMLESAKQYGPKNKVYIMLGANGIDYDKPTFIDGYRQFVASVKEQYPGAIIYLQSMTPVTKECYINYPSVNNKKIEEYNLAIMELASEMGVYYLDVFQALMDENGELPMDASPDGMHMTPEYYNKWFDYLKTHTVEVS